MVFTGIEPTEKRLEPRIDLEIQVTLKSALRSAQIVGWIQDVSHGGFKVTVDNSSNFNDIFSIGEEICFETFDYFPRLTGQGEVMWTSFSGNVAGVKFGELSEDSKSSLEEFLRIFNVLSHQPNVF